MALEEVVIGRHTDPDFGALERIETRTCASVNGGPMRPLIFREWTGRQADLNVDILISSEEDPPTIAAEVRADFRHVMSNIDDFKRRVAQSELELAKDWVAQAGMDLPLDESRFASLLIVDGFSIGPGRLTVWLQETANIFGGHLLEVRIEKGKIIEICLAG